MGPEVAGDVISLLGKDEHTQLLTNKILVIFWPFLEIDNELGFAQNPNLYTRASAKRFQSAFR